MLKGVSVACRKRLNPAEVTPPEFVFRPPGHPGTARLLANASTAYEAGLKRSNRLDRQDSDCPSTGRSQKAQRSSTCRPWPTTAGHARQHRPARPCHASNRRRPQNRSLCPESFLPWTLRKSRGRRLRRVWRIRGWLQSTCRGSQGGLERDGRYGIEHG